MDDGQQQLPLDAGKRCQVADEGEAEGGPLGWGGGVEEGVAEEGVEGGEGGQLAVGWGWGVLEQDGDLAEELGGCSSTHVECLGGGQVACVSSLRSRLDSIGISWRMGGCG